MLTDVADIRNQLRVIQEKLSRERSDEMGLSDESETDLEMGFPKYLTGEKEDEIDAWAPEKRVAIQKRDAPETDTKAQAATPEENMAQTRVTVLPRVTPDSKLPKITEAQYTVQLHSFVEESKAHEMVEDLEKSGIPAYIREREVKGRTYYRVNSGIFTRKGAAENYAEELFKKNGISGLVMRLSVNND